MAPRVQLTPATGEAETCVTTINERRLAVLTAINAEMSLVRVEPNSRLFQIEQVSRRIFGVLLRQSRGLAQFW